MKHAITLTLVCGMLTVPCALAGQADVDGIPAAAPAPTSASGPAEADSPVLAASTSLYPQAIAALSIERQAFVESFDWTRDVDHVALTRDYARQMESFLLRELELKRDWYRETGQVERLERTEQSLERMTSPPAVLPEIVSDRQAAQTAPVSMPEGSK